jgi:osmotically-inducible protein OsmY
LSLLLNLIFADMKTNAEVKNKVLEELRWTPSLQAAEIGVAVQDGIVTLRGHVGNYAMKKAAERAARSVTGVRAVVQKMEVTPADGQRADADLAAAIRHVLEWNSELPRQGVQVQVQQGLVRLSGEVDWPYQKAAAEDAVQPLLGVTGILNGITLKGTAGAADLRAQVNQALRRNALLHAAGLFVGAQAQKITLRGKVHAWAEREAAEQVAWSAPGVLEVDNKIEVVDARAIREEPTEIYL